MSRVVQNFCIVIPSHVSWDFPTDYVAQTATVLSGKYPVLVVDLVQPITLWKLFSNKEKRDTFLQSFDFLKSKKGLSVFRPLGLIPFQRFQAIFRLNRKFIPFQVRFFLKLRQVKKPLLWLLSPLANEFVGSLGERAVVYDCVDFWRLLDPVENKKQVAAENWLLSQATVVFANSSALTDEHRGANANIHVVPCGCDTSLFQADKKLAKPKELAKIAPPIIGLVGHLDHRLDFSLIKRVIENNPKFSFVFIGPETAYTPYEKRRVGKGLGQLKKLPNTYFLGKKPKERLPSFIQWFNLGIVPYDSKIPFVAKSNPMKVYEYLAMGKPVVAIPIESLVELDRQVITLTDSAKEFSQAVSSFLNEWSEQKARLARRIAESHSWESKVGAMEKVLLEQGIIKDS